MPSTQDRLKGGDLRSIGAANAVAREAERDPAIARDLAAGLASRDPLVRMRCADALEKVTRRHPELLAGSEKQLRGLLDPEQPKELLWHVLQMAPRIRWKKAEIEGVFEAARGCLGSGSSIVKTFAMQALVELTRQVPSRLREVESLMERCVKSGTPAMKARGAKLMRKIESNRVHPKAGARQAGSKAAGSKAAASQTKGAAEGGKRKGMSYAVVRKLAFSLPDVEEGTSYGTPALKVRGKLMVRLREDGETIVVIVDFPMREALMQAEPETFFITDHYLNYPTVLVRLATIRSKRLREALGHSWRFVTTSPRGTSGRKIRGR
jgi:hypothetical protein